MAISHIASAQEQTQRLTFENRLHSSDSNVVVWKKLSEIKTATTEIFFDHFNGSSMNSSYWRIPTWTGPTDGTYVGRTQFRCVPAALPSVVNSNAVINLETFNPTGFSLYGTDLISQRSYSPGAGLIFNIRAKLESPTIGGIVAGIFSFDLVAPSNTIHNEIDFELLTNQLNYVHTNVYDSMPLGTGYPDSTQITDPITDYHVYTVIWQSSQISWYVDGNLIRTSTSVLPDRSMHFHINMWAPAQEWPSAYNVALQPVSMLSANQIYSLLVDSVRVDSLGVTTVGIPEIWKPELTFYPNPAHSIIYFNTTEPILVTVFDMKGSLLLNKEIHGQLNVSNLSPGVYVIRYLQGTKMKQKKLIIN